MKLSVLVGAYVAFAACGDSKDRPEPVREVPRVRRVIEPPVGIVRPLPPHLISANGVGPYRLGERLSDLLQQLPSGPRIAVFEIPNVLHRSLIRAEEGDSVRIGGEPNGSATFVAVVDPQVARTEDGIHVGSTRAEVAKAGLYVDPARARDPRIAIPEKLRGVRLMFDPERTADRVAAIVVTPDAGAPAREGGCTRPADTATAFGACLTNNGERITVTGNEITIRSAESDKVLAPLRLPTDVVFAAPLRHETRDELVVITRSDEAQSRTWNLVAYRSEGGKLIRSVEPTTLYTVSATNARWIGVDLHEIDLFLELASTKDTIEVGGLLTTRSELPDAQGPWRDIVVLSPIPVSRRHGKSASPEESTSIEPPASDAGSPDEPDSGSD